MMTHTMRERLSEKNGSHKTVFGVLSNKKYEVSRLSFEFLDCLSCEQHALSL